MQLQVQAPQLELCEAAGEHVQDCRGAIIEHQLQLLHTATCAILKPQFCVLGRGERLSTPTSVAMPPGHLHVRTGKVTCDSTMEAWY